ncbi:MAG: hypothetical protein U0800_12190 [Isosphaeraceae bacterium]
MQRSIGLVLNGFALIAGLAIVGDPAVARAQQAVGRSPSFSRGMYPAGPIGGVQQFNPNWRSDAQPAAVSYNNYGYGISNYGQYYGNMAQNYAGNGYGGGYGNGWGNGYGGYGSGYGNGWNNGGWSLTNWPVPYAVSGATGNAYIQLPSYGFSGVTNGTGYGVARYGSYSNQVGAFGIPFGRSYGTTSSYTGGSAFGW